MLVSTGRHGEPVYVRYILPPVPLVLTAVVIVAGKLNKTQRLLMVQAALWVLALWTSAVVSAWAFLDMHAPWNEERAQICCARAPSVLHAACSLHHDADTDYVLAGTGDCSAWERVSAGLFVGALVSFLCAAHATHKLSGYIVRVLMKVPLKAQHHMVRPRLVGLIFGIYSIAIAIMLAGQAGGAWEGGHRGAAVATLIGAVLCVVFHKLAYVIAWIALIVNAVVFLGPLEIACSNTATRARLGLTDSQCSTTAIRVHIAIIAVGIAALWAADLFVVLRQMVLLRTRASHA